MRPLKLLLIICSFAACTNVPRPDVDLCIINAPGESRRCFNMKNDYDSDGQIKSGVEGVLRPNHSVTDLNKAMCVDSPAGFEQGLAELKTYIKLLREECKK